MILDKAKMAHDWAMKHGKSDSIYNREETVEMAWQYADAMQKEADKREKQKTKDDAESSKVFFEKLTESHCSHETQTGSIPDRNIESFKCKLCNELVDAEKWKDSLRKRPIKKEPIIDWSNTSKDAIAYKIVDGIVKYLHGIRSSDGTLCGGYLANDGWIKIEKRP